MPPGSMMAKGQVDLVIAGGDVLRRQGKLDEAEALYQLLLEREPETGRAHAGLGWVMRVRGDLAAAQGHFDAAVQAEPENAWFYLDAGENLRALGRWAEAEAVYRQALVYAPESGRGHSGLGWAMHLQSKRAEAQAHFDAAVQAEPQNSWYCLDSADNLRVLGRLAEAEILYREVLAHEPGIARAHGGLGQVLRQRGEALAAQPHLDVAVAAEPENIWLGLDSADNLRALGRLGEAEALYRQLLARAPERAQIHAGLGWVLQLQGGRAEAQAHFDAAVQAAPENTWYSLESADNLRALARLDEAEALYRQVLAGAPDNGPAQAGLGHVLRQRGDRVAAQALFDAARAAAPENIWLGLDSADNLRALARFDAAEALYRQLLAHKPDMAQAHAGLGWVLNLQGDRAAAQPHFDAAARAEPQNAWYGLDSADNLRMLGRLDDAASLYRQVLAHEPENGRAHGGLGHVLARTGSRAAAQPHLDAAVLSAPENIWFCMDAADNLRALERLDEAEALYRQWLAREPDNAEACAGLGHVARQRGRREEALARFEAAARAAPDNLWYRLEIASEQRAAGQFAAARQNAAAVLQGHPACMPALLNLAETEMTAGQHEAALAILTQAQPLDPQNPDILVELAVTEYRLGHQEACSAHLAAALAIDPLNVAAVQAQARQHLLAEQPLAALELMHQAARQRPEEIAFQNGMLEAFIAAGLAARALALIDAMQNFWGPRDSLCLKRIDILRQTGRYYEAVAAGRAATALFPNKFWIWVARFEAELHISDDAALVELLDAAPAVTVHEKATLLRRRGTLAELRGQFGEATRQYEAAVSLNPEDASTQLDLVRVHLFAFDLAAAKRHLSRYRDLEAPSLRLRGKSLNVSQTFYGQILDEYMLNETPPQVQPLLAEPLPARLAALLELATQEPSNTAAAVSFLLTLRAAGGLSQITQPGGTPIPRRIIQFWDTPEIPEDVAAYRDSWRQANPDYEVLSFDAATAGAFLEAHHPPEIHQAYKRTREAAQKADIFRLAVLLTLGGVYADADDRCQRSLGLLLPEDAALALYQEDLGTLGNNFIAVAPGHPVLALALQMAVTAINRGDTDIVWLSTGPALLTRAFVQAYARGAAGLPGLTLVFERRKLYGTVAIHCDAAYKKTIRHWSNSTFAAKKKD